MVADSARRVMRYPALTCPLTDPAGAIARRTHPPQRGPYRRAAHGLSVTGHPLLCGHFIPEEAPEELIADLFDFLQE